MRLYSIISQHGKQGIVTDVIYTFADILVKMAMTIVFVDLTVYVSWDESTLLNPIGRC